MTRVVGEFELAAHPERLRLATTWLTKLGADHGVPTDASQRLDLCLHEALANVIDHGDTAARSSPVRLSLRVSIDGVQPGASVTVSDAGAAFNPLTAPTRPLALSLADAEPGGLGLLMLREMADELQYSRNDERNELCFTVRWPASQAA